MGKKIPSPIRERVRVDKENFLSPLGRGLGLPVPGTSHGQG